jgi:hypothetical protein
MKRPLSFTYLGLHPLGHAELARNGKTCYDCAQRVRKYTNRGRTAFYCDLQPLTGGGEAEIQPTWPACTFFRQPD